MPGSIRTSPGIVVATAVVLVSLIGLPPLAGFVSKFLVFSSLVEAITTGAERPLMLVLLVVGGLNTVISLFYYLRVLKVMTFDPPPAERTAEAFPLGVDARGRRHGLRGAGGAARHLLVGALRLRPVGRHVRLLTGSMPHPHRMPTAASPLPPRRRARVVAASCTWPTPGSGRIPGDEAIKLALADLVDDQRSTDGPGRCDARGAGGRRAAAGRLSDLSSPRLHDRRPAVAAAAGDRRSPAAGRRARCRRGCRRTMPRRPTSSREARRATRQHIDVLGQLAAELQALARRRTRD